MKLFISLCILWLLPFVFTAFFNHPAIDDYWNANAVIAHGKWGAVQYFYQTVSSRYTSLFIMSFCNTLPNGNVWMFKVFPITIILCLFFSIYFLYHSIFSVTASRLQTVALSLLFVVLHIANMRSLFEGLYWMSSTVCYQLAVCLFAIGMGAIIRDIKKPQLAMKIIAVVCSLLLPGTVEIIAPVYLLTLFVILYFSYQLHYSKSIIFYCLIVTFILLITLFLNKGNEIRIERDGLSYHPHVFEAMFYSVRSVAYYTAVWITTPINLFAFGLLHLSKQGKTKRQMLLITKRNIFLLSACFIMISLAVYLPLHLFESSIPFPRITTLFFFLLFQFCLVLYYQFPLFHFPSIGKIKKYLPVSYTKEIVFVVFFFCAFTTKNFVFVFTDLFNGAAAKYNEESYERYNIIRSCIADTCYVPLHQSYPYFAQLSAKENTDSDYFQHMNAYFKKTILFR